MLTFALIAVASYLLGSVPFGLLVGRWRRVDVRVVGSGRTGVANVLRAAGPAAAGAVFVGDLAKGVGAVLMARFLLAECYVYPGEVVAGVAAIAGHNWSLFIGFRGGRGVTTSFGTMLGLSPLVALVSAAALAVFALTVAVSRYISLGSMLASIFLLVVLIPLTVVGRVHIAHLILAALAVSLILWKHRDNIARLRAGTERRVGERAEKKEAQPT